MSGQSSLVFSKDIDDIDIIMSQIKTGESEFDENVHLVEQMSVEPMEASFATTEIDDMDEIMSQIDIEEMQQNVMDEQEIVDADLHRQINAKYDAAASEISDEIVNQMQQEVDVEHEIPPELVAEYNQAMDQIIPAKSGNRYLQAYDVFRKWQASHRTNSFDEKILLAYFGEAAKKYKPPTLWSMYSMLKKTLMCKHDVDLVKHCRLRAFLKMKSDGYEATKAYVFESEQLQQFFIEAPNHIYLGMKVVMVFGLCGGCRGDELTNLTVANVKDDGKELIVKIPETKTKVDKMYIVGNEFAKVIRHYLEKRPVSVKTNRLFLQWRRGKCVAQVMGKHTIAKIPKEVASFLNLPEPHRYTGHSIRRTTTTVAANAGFSITELKRLMGWKSDRVAEGYIQDSTGYKRTLAKRLSAAILGSTSEGDTTYSDILPSFEGATPSSFTPIVPPTIPAVVPPTIPAVMPPTIPTVVSPTIPTVVSPTIPAVVPSKISGAAPILHSGIKNAELTASTPTSIKFDSSSGLVLSSGGKSITVSGPDASQNGQNKEQSPIFYFGGDNNTFTIVNMK